MADVMDKHHGGIEPYKVLFMGMERAKDASGRSFAASVESLRVLRMHPADMPRILLKVSVYGVLATRWADSSTFLDANILAIKNVAVAGRMVTFMVRDPTKGDDRAGYTVYAFMCEGPEMALTAGRCLSQACKTIAATLGAMRRPDGTAVSGDSGQPPPPPDSAPPPLPGTGAVPPPPDGPPPPLDPLEATPSMASGTPNKPPRPSAPPPPPPVPFDLCEELDGLSLNVREGEVINVGTPSVINGATAASDAELDTREDFQKMASGEMAPDHDFVRRLSSRMQLRRKGTTEVVYKRGPAKGRIKVAIKKNAEFYHPPVLSPGDLA